METSNRSFTIKGRFPKSATYYLCWEGIKDDHPLSDSNLLSVANLHMVERKPSGGSESTSLSSPAGEEKLLQGHIHVHVKTLKTDSTYEVKREDTVKPLKQTIEKKYNIPTDQQHLFFDGKELEDAHTLFHCGIHQDSILRLIHPEKLFPI